MKCKHEEQDIEWIDHDIHDVNSDGHYLYYKGRCKCGEIIHEVYGLKGWYTENGNFIRL